jgi:AraC-like DNA-binding protein
LIFCTKGKGWAEIDGCRFTISAGAVLFIPAKKPHAYGADNDEPWSIHWAHFAGTAAASYATLLPAHEYVLSIPSADAKEIARLFRESYRLASTGLTERTVLLVSHTLRYVLGRVFFQTGRSLGGGSRAIAHDLTKSIEFMRANVARSLTLQELSRHTGLSPTRYSALFREQTGSSPVDHHIRLRMQAACHYLDTTALSVKEVAAKLGYDDPYYFSRIFQKILGCSPLAYRRSVKG